ncbi:hypothetical protein [Pseudophaeobacter sp.]|uniref:O-linked N-acetylglucosamine transferase family protein n=1 Tax=Pseudophaeobacter sp. TaxID=1971739 RepID=UPI0032988804
MGNLYDLCPQPRTRQHQFIRGFAYVYHDVGSFNGPQTAALARQEHLDIAIDLKGVKTDSRPGIFAIRVAPIQVYFPDFPATTGIKEMEYLIAEVSLSLRLM